MIYIHRGIYAGERREKRKTEIQKFRYRNRKITDLQAQREGEKRER